jgi:hypothetical protein
MKTKKKIFKKNRRRKSRHLSTFDSASWMTDKLPAGILRGRRVG